MNFYAAARNSWKATNSLLCVGLDAGRGFAFDKRIIDATHDFVCAYKPNTAFYEARGSEGIKELKKTCAYIKATYPHLVLIIDAKRGDIGSTNGGYVSFVFDYLGGDAVTLHPYLGKEAMRPFLSRKGKGSLILCRTSNPGAGEFQDSLYKTVAQNVAQLWNTNNNCGLVVGATYPKQLKIVRHIVQDMPLLIPGIGAQGGDLKQTVRNGVDSHGAGMFLSVSRSIIFAKDPRTEAAKLKEQINGYRR